MKKQLLFIYILASFLSHAQQVIIKGKITDKKTNLPLEQATVYLTSLKDSTVAFYDLTKKNGNFEIKTTKQNKAFYLKVSYLGYNNHSQLLEKIDVSKDFGTITLSESENILGEVVLKSEIPPVRMKNDTLEFNAQSFKVRPDANVEALLRELPGVEIDPDGKITINGKPVDQILVNGKPFFDKDGKVAMQNLPSEIIEKIQIVDTKTKEEELTGQATVGNEKTINLTIDEENNKGYFGKATAGYGTEKRYESSLLFNTFKEERRFSILASSNNINSIGFSQDEIFDNMNGGRNTSFYSNSDGSFGFNNMTFGGNQGITQSNMMGVNYTNKIKKVEFGGNYLLSNTDSDYISKSNSTNLLPTTTTFSENKNNRNNLSNSHNLDLNIQFKIDSLTTIYFEPSLKNLKTNTWNSRNNRTQNTTNQLLNESISNDNSENNNKNFSNFLEFVRKSKKNNNRGFSFSLNTNNETQENLNLTNSNTIFYNSNTSDIRNQKIIDKNTINSIEIESGFFTNLKDSLSFGMELGYQTKIIKNETATNDFNSFTNDYNTLNASLSNLFIQNNNTFSSSFRLSLSKKNYGIYFKATTYLITQKNTSNYLNIETDLTKNEVLPSLRFSFNYKLSDKKYFYISSSYSYNLPTAMQLLPVLNLSNPLSTSIGNPNLKPSYNWYNYLTFNKYDWGTRTGYYLSLNYYKTFNPILNATVFDADFKSNTTFVNMDNSQNINFYADWGKNFKKDKRDLKIGISINPGFEYREGIINNLKYESREKNISSRIYFKWSIQDLITLKPSYSIDFNNTNFKNYSIENTNFYTQNIKMELTTYVPKNLVFGNDFSYNYNSNISDGFQKDFYLWNMSLGYSFYKEKFTTKVKVYDVLNQNIGVRRTVTPSQITDSENNVLQRYMMFSLTYKLDKIGKKKEENSFFME
jgi:hypothetical protein